jgi:hypothetical protein
MAGIRAKFNVLSACASCLDGSDVYDPDSEYLMAIRNSALADDHPNSEQQKAEHGRSFL